MHELSLCEAIVETAQQQVAHHSCQRVLSIHLEIGKLSCVEVEAMQFAFEAVAKGGVADSAALKIDTIAGVAWCQQCQREVMIEQRYDACPECEACPLQVRQGDAMRIKEMEII